MKDVSKLSKTTIYFLKGRNAMNMKKSCAVLIAIIVFGGFSEMATAGSVPWDKIIKEGRFKVLSEYKDEAVLDLETGLVWERYPDGQTERNFVDAEKYCYDKIAGDRMGWRLPTIQEWGSLMDQSQQHPSLPSGHPFKGMAAYHHWSSTNYIGDPESAWYVNINRGGVSIVLKSFGRFVWCVRSGPGGRFAAMAAAERKWDTATRYKVLSDFNDEAVLDTETGLVWERVPDTTQRNWVDTQLYCNDKWIAGQKGWRVPTMDELVSLGDPIIRGPALPAGHPFKVKIERYSTTSTINANYSYYMHLNTPGQSGLPNFYPRYAWCVRGGEKVDPQ